MGDFCTFPPFLALLAHMQSQSVAWLDQQWFQGLCLHGMFRLYNETSLLSETMLHSTAGQTESHFFLYPSTRFTIAPTISVICSYSPLWNDPICVSALWHTANLQHGGIWVVFALTCQWKYPLCPHTQRIIHFKLYVFSLVKLNGRKNSLKHMCREVINS